MESITTMASIPVLSRATHCANTKRPQMGTNNAEQNDLYATPCATSIIGNLNHIDHFVETAWCEEKNVAVL